MSRNSISSILGILLFFGFACERAFAQPFRSAPHKLSAQAPLSFEPNVGQAETASGFVTRTDKYRVSIGPEGFSFYPNLDCAHGEDCGHAPITIRYVNGRSLSSGMPDSTLETVVNYYVGSRDRWRIGVPTYGGVTYSEIYPGIDAKFHGATDEMEFDFVLRPGASPDIIRLAIAGSPEAIVTPKGEVLLAKGIAFRPPEAYQIIGGQRRPVSVRFKKTAGLQIGFAVGKYDRRQPLIIDPVVSFLTYLGGSSRDEMAGLVVDGSGNIIVLGSTISTDFPTTAATQGINHGSEDLIISKLNSAGTALIYSTYLGGGQSENAGGIAIDSSGNVYIAGTTASTNFPTTSGAYSSGCPGPCSSVVAKLSPSGTLVFSTYLGGIAHAIAVDSQGNSYITGTVSGGGLDVVNAFQPTFQGSLDTSHSNAFLTKLNASGSGLVYSTYFGNEGQTNSWAVGVDSSGSAYIAGDTSGVPLQNPLTEDGGAFLTKFSPDGSSLVYSTLLGQGSIASVGVDAQQEAYVLGTTTDSSFPLTANASNSDCGFATDNANSAFCAFNTIFLTKIASDGASEVFSTFIGPGRASHIAIDNSGNAYGTGGPSDSTFPILNPIQSNLQGSPNANEDAVVFKVSSAGQLLFSSFLGGQFSGDTGVGIAADNSGNIYLGGTTEAGSSDAPDFPVVAAFRSTVACCNRHLFVGKIAPTSSAVLSLSPRIGRVLELRNLGSAAVNNLNITAPFVVANNCGTTLSAGATCEITINGTGTLTVSSNAGSQGFPVTFSLIQDPMIRLSRYFVHFPAQQVGTTSPTQGIIVKNVGTINSNISSLVVGGDIQETNNCVGVLTPQHSCSITVQFSPISQGSGGGTIAVNYDNAGQDSLFLSGAGVANALIASAKLVDFKTQSVGVPSLTRIVNFTNASPNQISIGTVNISGEFSQVNNCGVTLASHASCRAVVSFVPSSNGLRLGSLSLSDSTHGLSASLNLRGTGRIPSDLQLSAFDLDFFTFPLGGSFSQSVQVANVSSSVVSFNSITTDSDYTQLNSCGASLGPSQSCSISVTFAPKAVGPRNGTLWISHNGMGSPLNVNLTGAGRKALTVPDKVDLGSWAIGDSSDPGVASVGNGSPPAVNILSASATGSFTVSLNNCTTVNVSVCQLLIIYHPSAPGLETGQLTINTSDPASPYLVDLSGTGLDGPLFHMDSPNGGEIWQAGTQHQISWSYTGTPSGMVDLQLCPAGVYSAYPCQALATGVPAGSAGSGGYTWMIPVHNPLGDFKVKIGDSSNNHFRDVSDSSFSITVPRLLELSGPNGGAWDEGEQAQIGWVLSGTNVTSTVTLELWSSGSLVKVLASGLPVGAMLPGVDFYTYGGYSFTPDVDLAPGTHYRVRVRSDQEPDLFDDSNNDFTVYAPSNVTVISPNGGETWAPGSTHSIQWSYTGDPSGFASIQLLKDGNIVSYLASLDMSGNTSGNGSYPWTLPQFQMGDYTVRIIIHHGATDESDGTFRIQGAGYRPVSPIGGERWSPGTTHTIKWIYGTGVGPNVKVSVGMGGAATPTVIAAAAPVGSQGHGQIDWAIPAHQPVGSYFLLLQDTTSSQLFSAQSGFTIDFSSLTLTSPHGGELWRPGTNQGVQWYGLGDVGVDLKIELLKSGVPVGVLAAAAPVSSGSVGYAVPPGITPGNDYRVRITSNQQPSFTSTSSSDFTIADKFTLTVLSGGKVDSDPPGINACAGTCSAYFDNGSDVTLTPQTGPNEAFIGWGGACNGIVVPCTVHMDTDRNVSAQYGGPGVNVTTAHNTVYIAPSKAAPYSLQLVPVNNFTGAVIMSCSGLPAGVTCSFVPSTPINLANNQTQNVSLTVTTQSTTPLAESDFSVFATRNGVLYELPLILRVQNFTQAVAPAAQNVFPGATASYNVVYTPQAGMSQPITVGCGIVPAGITCTPNPSTVSPGTTPGNQSVVTLQTTAGTTPVSNSSIAITGTSIGVTRSTNVTLSVKDFTVTANTATVATNVGSNVTDTILVKGLNGFTGVVNLSCVIVGTPTGTNCTLSNLNPTASATGTSVTATIISTAATTPFGTYTVRVTGTNNGQQKIASFTVNIKDFTLGLGVNEIIIPQPPPGQSSVVTVPITLTAENGFNTFTALSCVGQPTGVTCAFSPASGIPTIGGLHSTLTITGASTAAVGPHDISVKGTAGTLVRPQTLEVDLWGPNFTQAVTPTIQNVTAGSSAAYTVVYTPFGGMNEDIAVGCGALPAGVTCTPIPAVVTPGTTPGNQSIVTLQTTFAVTPGANATVAISGVSSSIGVSRSTNVTLSVKDFTVTANTATVATNVGTNITDTILVKGLNGFTGNVALSCVIVGAPAGMGCNTANLNPAATAAGTTVVTTITSTPGTAVAGTYTAQVTGTNSGQSKTASFTVNIKDFTLGTGTGAITIPRPPASQSGSLTVPVTLTSLNGFNSSTALSCTGQPTGITCAFSPASGVPTMSGLHATLTVTSTSTVLPSTYHLQVKAIAGTLIRTQTLDVTDFGPNFTQAITPATQNVTNGSSAAYTVVYTPLGGMTDDIGVGCGALPAGVACTPVPATVTPNVTPGNQSVVTLQTSFGATPAANATIPISGVSAALGDLTRSTNVILSVKDFTVTANTATIATNVGTNITDTILVKALNGFVGNIPLTCLIVGTPTGTACNLSNANPAASAAGTSVIATITSTAATTPNGTYTVQVTGTTGAGSKIAQFMVNIKDFSLGVTPDSQSIAHTGGPLNFTATLTALNGFNSFSTLSCVGPLPTGITCAFGGSNTSSLNVAPTGSGANANVRISVANGTATNTYPITIRAVSGLITRTQTITVNVTP